MLPGVILKFQPLNRRPPGSARTAVAAGRRAGGYDSIFEAARHMARLKDEMYQPIPANQKIYDRLFAEYVRLHDYFGRGENNVMKTLKQIRDQVS